MVEPSYAFLTPAQAPDEIGRLGSYRVLKLLGEGGMGLVFQAEDLHLQRPVALKVMKAEAARNPAARQRFLREARAAAALKHDNVITIYQVAEDRGVPFLAMEYLRGQSLDQWLCRHKPTVPQILKLGREVAEGLAAAHARGLIHRDIKPANVWLEAPHGRVKILDFGLARTTSGDDLHLTRTGTILGTPAYMSPEQARSEKVDGRSDLFSLGVVLYRLCTGAMPFAGDTVMAVLASLLTTEPAPVRNLNPEVPEALGTLVMQLLAKRVEDRPQSARAVVDAIQRIRPGLAHRTIVGPPRPPLPVTVSVVSPSPFADWTEATSKDPPARMGGRAVGAAGRVLPERTLLLFAGTALAAVGLVAGVLLLVLLRGEKPSAAPNRPEEVAKQPPEPAPAGSALGFHPLEHGNTVTRVLFSPDGKLLASGGDDGAVKLWDARTGKERISLPQRSGVAGLAFSRDGNILAAWSSIPTPAGRRHRVKFWDLPSAREIPFLEKEGGGYAPVAFSQDGLTVATASPDHTVKLWHLPTKKEIGVLDEDSGAVQCLAIDPEGKRLAAGYPKVIVALWDLDTRKKRFSWDETTPGAAFPQVHCLAFTADGKTLVSGTGAFLAVYDVSTGMKRWKFRRHLFALWNLSLSPDSSMIASAGGSGDLAHAIITDVASGETIRELPSWKGYKKGGRGASSVAFSPDGKLLVTAGPDHTLKVWDTATWEERCPPPGAGQDKSAKSP